jgi:hypothetical protein
MIIFNDLFFLLNQFVLNNIVTFLSVPYVTFKPLKYSNNDTAYFTIR